MLLKVLTGVLEKLDQFYQISYLRGDLRGLATIFTTLDADLLFCVITAQLPSATEFSGWKSAHFLLRRWDCKEAPGSSQSITWPALYLSGTVYPQCGIQMIQCPGIALVRQMLTKCPNYPSRTQKLSFMSSLILPF